jgi:hypothetical protein
MRRGLLLERGSLRENLKVKAALLAFSGAVLSSKVPVGYVDLRVFAHATEDPERVLAAVRNVLPSELVDSVVFSRSSLTGHYGNPIVLFEARVRDKFWFGVDGQGSFGCRDLEAS